MKKQAILKIILLGILSVFLLYGTVYSYNNSDPWGLTFAVATIPFAILSIIVIYKIIKTIMSINEKDNNTKCGTFKLIYIFPLILVSFLLTGITLYSVYSSPESEKISEDYIAVFNGGSGEITYSTYIYKIDNGFKYINTSNTTTSWGSSDWDTKITSSGKVSKADDVFTIAEKNNAYSYVKLPNEDKVYSIDEFKSMFLKK